MSFVYEEYMKNKKQLEKEYEKELKECKLSSEGKRKIEKSLGRCGGICATALHMAGVDVPLLPEEAKKELQEKHTKLNEIYKRIHEEAREKTIRKFPQIEDITSLGHIEIEAKRKYLSPSGIDEFGKEIFDFSPEVIGYIIARLKDIPSVEISIRKDFAGKKLILAEWKYRFDPSTTCFVSFQPRGYLLCYSFDEYPKINKLVNSIIEEIYGLKPLN